ncbi:Aste57867_13509 [Aphanomyces stellatus]|uniref:Fructose-1,6-bisphosphatase, cytosolic n=1 Tax=Aphanomyces stellatus TaxID=120398 RepID=A0A485KYK6_9STRA|nr:hypothetical protein As57867_013459 [Aphanomyces stellatus]VFT90347.1 Aste57867_13509 [Aphanomyces stellatus]
MSVDHSNPITLSRFVLADKTLQKNNDLCIVFNAIELACKVISSAVRRAGLTGLYGLDGSVNSTGDDVKKLDLLSNDIFINSLKNSTKIELMVSEENEEPIHVETNGENKFCIAFDPLDGSSNIDCNISTGTIFAIWEKKPTDTGVEGILQPGNKLVAAGYCMYGSSTQLVLTWGNGVNGFTLDPTIGSFILSHPDIKIPENPKTIYSCNEGNLSLWDAQTTQFVEECKNKPKPYSARYVGSMVSDVHRTLLYGGIFFYPADKKSKSGKLRLLYEANPMSFIVEQAGGISTTGTKRVLDLIPTSIHERSPIFLGCKRDVNRILELYGQPTQ